MQSVKEPREVIQGSKEINDCHGTIAKPITIILRKHCCGVHRQNWDTS